MERNSSVRKVQEAPPKRLIDATMPDLREAVAEVLTELLEGQPAAKEPPEWLTRREGAEYLRVSTAQLDLLSRREHDPIPFEQVGDSRRFNRNDLREWVRRQRKAGTP